jgi:2-octaprenyl-6-methoxyphenol hydroxylase
MHYDLIIIGGGLVGKSLACALRHTSLKIALVDAAKLDRPDPRLIALNYGSFSFLESLGLGPLLQPKSAAIQAVHVSHRGRFGISRLEAQKIQLPALGYVVRAQHINESLDHILLKTQEVNYTELRPAKVKALELHEEKTALTVEQEGKTTRITGSLILAADGTGSTIRKLLNFETETIDYEQSALVTTSTLGRSHHHIAYERFLEDGALAMLPLHNEDSRHFTCATIWTASTKTIAALAHLDEAAFLQTLQTQFGYRLGQLKCISERHVFPLQFIQVKNPLKGNVLLLGNAAHTIHPLAAQGLNLALYELAHLTQLLLKNIATQQPLQQGLAEKRTQFQPRANLLFSHYLNQLFSSENLGLNFARQLGMVGLDLCPPIKKQLSRLLAMENLKWLKP